MGKIKISPKVNKCTQITRINILRGGNCLGVEVQRGEGGWE